MKVKTLPLLAGAVGMLAVTGFANAGITGLYVQSQASNTLANTTLEGTTYAIYVQFDDPTDRFNSVLDGALLFVGGNLYQHDSPNGFDTDLGEHNGALNGIEENLAADSYVNVAGATQAATPSGDGSWDGVAFANGVGITGGWFVSPPTSTDNDLDANNRTLIMFLTFTGAGHPVADGIITSEDAPTVFNSTLFADLMLGSIRVSYNPQGVAGGITGVTFNFGVPAPGALALLGVAGLVGKRRRR